VIANLRAAGAVFFGKLNMHEMAMGGTSANAHYGAVRNPWNPAHHPGGSSGA
jgi:aspartyl-tRNA(Asn)/glutamyl-tRNA(Gln) amidotransferase subunit A